MSSGQAGHVGSEPPPDAGPGGDSRGAGEVAGAPTTPIDRAAAFATEGDRAALFAAGPTPIPRKAVVIALCAVLVLGGGGTLLEHVLSSAGLNPKAAPTATTTPPTTLPSGPAPLPAAGAYEPVSAPLPAFMGLERPTSVAAPRFSLIDQEGGSTSLQALHGSVVVLSFFDGACNDICPVLATELHQADVLLGPRAADVQFVTVNTDPTALAVGDLSPAAAAGGLGTMANWHILTGPLATLNSVWHDYGITVTANTVTKAVAHTDLLYFIDPNGEIRYRATPFADEHTDGTYSLSATDVSRWALGIATYAGKLTSAP